MGTVIHRPRVQVDAGSPAAIPLNWRASGEDVLAAWPAERPLAVLWSGAHPPESGSRSRWRVLACPVSRMVAGSNPAPGTSGLVPPGAGRAAGVARDGLPPFLGGWIGVIRYEAGRVIEPAVGLAERRTAGSAAPLAEWLECPAAYVQDGATGAWWFVGDVARAGALPWGVGDGSGPEATGARAGAFGVRGLASTTGREAFERSVARAVEYIHAGTASR